MSLFGDLTRKVVTALNQRWGYDAGSYDRVNANWHAHIESAETTNRYSRQVVRGRARDLERNSDIANGLLSYIPTFVALKYSFIASIKSSILQSVLFCII